MNALGRFIRQRAKELGKSLTDIAREAGTGRQTLYAISAAGGRLPDLNTLVKVGLALEVHPLRLVQLSFENYSFPSRQTQQHQSRGDQSQLVADVTIPDGTVVMLGAKFTKVWELQNLGTVAWEGRSLRCMDDAIEVRSALTGQPMQVAPQLTPTVRQIPIPFTPPGGAVRLAVDFEAPSIPCSTVSYWKSVFEDGRLCLPHSLGLTCVVRVISIRSEDRLDGLHADPV